jgi:hypothetical protein
MTLDLNDRERERVANMTIFLLFLPLKAGITQSLYIPVILTYFPPLSEKHYLQPPVFAQILSVNLEHYIKTPDYNKR